MMEVRYEYPLSNDGKGYKLTEEELVRLLNRVYEKGRMDERGLQMNITESITTKSISSGVWVNK